MKQIVLVFLICGVLAACSDEENKKEVLPPSATVINLPPTLSLEERQTYETGFEQLRQLHTSMDAIWGAISRGETAQCGTQYEIISPERFSDDQPIGIELRTAAVELADAVRLWQAECENPRTEIPPDVIDRGVRMVLTAGDALREAEQLLSE